MHTICRVSDKMCVTVVSLGHFRQTQPFITYLCSAVAPSHNTNDFEMHVPLQLEHAYLLLPIVFRDREDSSYDFSWMVGFQYASSAASKNHHRTEKTHHHLLAVYHPATQQKSIIGWFLWFSSWTSRFEGRDKSNTRSLI